PLRFPPKGRRAPQRLFPSRREPHRRLAPVLRRSRPDQAKLFERLDVAPDRRAVQFRDPSESGQGNRSGALDFSQETVLGERHPRRLEDRIVERGRLSRRAPHRGAIADGLHIAGIYPHCAGIASGAFAGAKPRPPRTPPAKLGSARTAAATSDRASLRPSAAPAGGETRSTGFGSAPCKFSMRIVLRKSEVRAMLFSFAGWSPLGRALLGGRTGGLHLCC